MIPEVLKENRVRFENGRIFICGHDLSKIKYCHYYRARSVVGAFELLSELDRAFGLDWLERILGNLDSIDCATSSPPPNQESLKDIDPAYYYARCLAIFLANAPPKARTVTSHARRFVFGIILNIFRNLRRRYQDRAATRATTLPAGKPATETDAFAIDNDMVESLSEIRTDDLVAIEAVLLGWDPENRTIRLGIPKNNAKEFIKKFQASLVFYYQPASPLIASSFSVSVIIGYICAIVALLAAIMFLFTKTPICRNGGTQPEGLNTFSEVINISIEQLKESRRSTADVETGDHDSVVKAERWSDESRRKIVRFADGIFGYEFVSL